MGLDGQPSSKDTALLLLVQVPATMTGICMTAMVQIVHICHGRQGCTGVTVTSQLTSGLLQGMT